ncbi:hypothetical protein ABFA07_012709 [Porites harrisoni]
MDEEKIDIGLIQRFRSGISVDKKSKKKVLAIFKYLTGKESPIEAVELTVRRDQHLREAQLKVMYEMVKLVEDPPTLKTGSIEKQNMFSVFLSTELLNFVVRLLWIRIPNESLGTNDQPWHASHFNSLMVLKHILTLPQYTRINCKHLMEINTVEALLDFCDADFDLLGLYPAVCALKTLTCLEREACDRIVLLSGISKIGKVVLKDNCQKMIVKAYKSGITSSRPYIKRVLEDRRDQCLDNFKRAELPSTADLPLNILRSWSYKIQMNAAVVLLKIAEQNDRYRKLILKDKVASKAVITWIKTPSIAASDCTMIAMCLKVAGMISQSEELTWQLIDSYGIIEFLEDGVLIPDNAPINAFLELIEQMSTHSGRCRNKILENEEILQALGRYMFSYNKEIQGPTLRALANLSESDEMAKNLIKCGVTPKNITLVTIFYQHPAIGQAQRIQKTLKRTCHKLWIQEEIAFGKERFDFFSQVDEESARVLKDIGNKQFKSNSFDEAIRRYTEALNCCPQGTEASKAGKDGRWMVLPAVLYSNRAQCHLNKSEWQSALNDCNEAMARCLEENEEAEKILLKTMFRRSKAFMELGHHQRALNDISFCLRTQVNNTGNANNVLSIFWEVLGKYRKAYGPEPIRRCGNCIGGDGDKLKRCANCEEVYCSKECQVLAWEKGHKNLCNK